MSDLTLKPNQAALLLEVSPEGEVNVEAVFPNEPDGAGALAVSICTVIGQKLTENEEFQNEIMACLDDE